MSYDEFIAEWNGRQVKQYGGECVALVAEFEAENNRPIVWGDASTWVNNPIMYSAYDWIDNNPNDPNQVPTRGDIIVWGANLPYTGGAGHIAFFDMILPNHRFQSFGQNSGGPTAHFQSHSWAYVSGWYTAKHVSPPPAPAPQPIAHAYTIENITPKQVRMNKDTHKWGMHYDNFTAIANNPEGNAATGDVKTVVAICHHNIGYKYYLEDANVPSGYNVLDCEDVPLPPPPPLPVPTPTPLPSAPISAPSDEQYELIVAVPGYATSNRAANHIDATSVADAGTYFVFNRFADMINITTVQGQPGAWINPEDNKEPLPEPPVIVVPVETSPPWTSPREDSPLEVAPVENPVLEVPEEKVEVEKPLDWRTTYKPFTDEQGNRVIRSYIATRPTLFVDFESKLPSKTMADYVEVDMSGTFVKDNITYLRPRVAAERFLWYGALEVEPATGDSNLELYDDGKTTLEERIALNTKSVGDYVTLVLNWLKGLLKLTNKKG